jgi:hypothetical protein
MNNSANKKNNIKTEKIISDDGTIMYNNSNNIQMLSKNNKPGSIRPIIQLYGSGGIDANVGINFDTFQSNKQANNGRYNGNNPATQILAIDNGKFSSDLIFKTSDQVLNKSILSIAEERMRIEANGNVNIVNDLNVLGNR